MSLIAIVTLLALGCVQGQFFEDRRCRCVCPNPATVLNTTITRQIYTENVPPSQCDCEHVVAPQLAELEGRIFLFCPRCDCVFQTRNTGLIMHLLLRGRNHGDLPRLRSDRHLDYTNDYRDFERARRARQHEVERLVLQHERERERNRGRDRPARDQPPDSEQEHLLGGADPDY